MCVAMINKNMMRKKLNYNYSLSTYHCNQKQITYYVSVLLQCDYLENK